MLSARKCVDCGKDISDRGWRATRCVECYKRYRREYARQLYHTKPLQEYYKEYRKKPHTKEIWRKGGKNYYRRHKEKCLALSKERDRKARIRWGISNGDIGKLAESIGKKILTAEGFTEIYRPYNTFLFDYLGRKDGQIYFIEITTAHKKNLKKTQLDFAKYFNIPIIILFIRPNLTQYRLIYPKTRNVHAESILYNIKIQQIPQEYLMEESA